eukprot:7654769-Ditylum_brightwellii.AAC.1
METWMKRVYHKEGHAIKLTLKTVENEDKGLDKFYQEHVEALLDADLEPVDFPTLDKIWEK